MQVNIPFLTMQRIIIGAVAYVLIFSGLSYAWMINEDYQQRDARDATDFHIFLAGDVKDQITGGGQTNVTNPFDDPERQITKTTIGNTQITFKSKTGKTISQSKNTDRHFGIFGTGKKPKVRFKAWSYGTSPYTVPVPKSNFDFLYDPDTQELDISVENISDDVVTFSEVGFLVFSDEQPIENLSRPILPPSVFDPLASLNHEYQIGETDTITLTNIPPTSYVVTYGTVQFSGSSADNAYNLPLEGDNGGTGGEWTQINVMDEIPEPATLLIFITGGVMMLRRRNWRNLLPVMILVVMLSASQSQAWTRGNHSGDWAKGQTIKIKVDTPPGNAAQQTAYLEALAEAMAEWNDAQAAFGGLKLELSTEANPDVHIKWKDNAASWGSVAPGKNPVEVTIESNDGINARGVTRILKHELGHVEGLGHSAKSALMKADAYSSTPGEAPSAADLNSNDPFTDPTPDDLAGKKKMWGTEKAISKSDTTVTVTPLGPSWLYDYVVEALDDLASYVDPVTELTIEVPVGTEESDFLVQLMPTGWEWQFWDASMIPSLKELDMGGVEAPSLISFTAISPSFGILPGNIAEFSIVSHLEPGLSRAFTNSPSYDSDEFLLDAPVPEPITLSLLALGGLGVICRRRQQA